MRTGAIDGRRSLPSGFQITIVIIGLAVAGTVLVTLGRLAWWAWDEYGTSIPSFYVHDVFGDQAIRQMLINTAIVVGVSSAIATLVASLLAWLNERTDASFGLVGSILPLIPFLMPALALPLGWLFLASPEAGILNIAIRGALRDVGIHVSTGPLDVYSWSAMIFLYSVFLCGFRLPGDRRGPCGRWTAVWKRLRSVRSRSRRGSCCATSSPLCSRRCSARSSCA